MDIIVDSGAHTLRNMGDVAMLQVTLQRLGEMLPQARPLVLTSRPDLLERYCPTARWLSAASRDAACLPAPHAWTRAWAVFRRRRTPAGPQEFEAAFARCSGILLAGGGYLNDANGRQTRATLRMLARATEARKFVALFGQGLGPMQQPDLCGLLRRICQVGTPVGLRENRVGPALLKAAGAQAMAVTGDDAIALVRAAPTRSAREALGFSLRIVDYSGLSERCLEMIQAALKELQNDLQRPVLPLPVSFNHYEDDPGALSRITRSPVLADGLDTPAALIERAGACRVVFTGTYHAAVFALAQGIPCLAFYASDYYQIKMEGLADLFPGGCRLVDLREPNAFGRLIEGCKALWATAPDLEGMLRSTALAQVVRAGNFYQDALGRTLARPLR